MSAASIERPIDSTAAAAEPADVVVIIPALNEEASLPLVLSDLPAVRRVIVVDNGSSDRTAEMAMRGGATVVHEAQRGYGAACLAGIRDLERLVDEGESPPAVVAFVDADYSDHPQMLPRLVSPILADRADLVLGSRLTGEREPGAMPPQSVYGNRLACFLMRYAWGISYTDLGPFRAISYEALRRLDMADTGFGWTIEMQIKAAVCGLRVEEVAVPYRCRVGKSKISGTLVGSVKAGGKILCTIAKYAWRTRFLNLEQPIR